MQVENIFKPLKLSKPLFLRFAARSNADPRALWLRDLLDLDPTRQSFAIIDTGSSGTEQLLSESGRQSRVLDDTAPLREIVLNNWSVMEVLRFASAYVAVPSGNLAAGVVRRGSAPSVAWLTVEAADTPPADAWLAVERDGCRMLRLHSQRIAETECDVIRQEDGIMEFLISVFLAAIRPDLARGLPVPRFQHRTGHSRNSSHKERNRK